MDQSKVVGSRTNAAIPRHVALDVVNTPITERGDTFGSLQQKYPTLKASVLPILKEGNLYETGSKQPFEYTRQPIVDHIYQMLEDVHNLFDKNNIPYLIDGGTQLGSTRHEGLIRWDDDADIVILESDEYRFLDLIPTFDEMGYILFAIISEKEVELVPTDAAPNKNTSKNVGYVFGGYQLCPTNGEVRPSCNLLYPGMDIYTLRPSTLSLSTKEDDSNNGNENNNNNKVLVYAPQQIQDIFPNMEFQQSEWESRTNVPFGHLQLSGLTGRHAIQRLNKLYGLNWSKKAETNRIDHKTVLLLAQKEKDLVSEDDMKAAFKSKISSTQGT